MRVLLYYNQMLDTIANESRVRFVGEDWTILNKAIMFCLYEVYSIILILKHRPFSACQSALALIVRT